MVTAIFLIALCAMTLTALSVALYTQVHRTQTAAEDAQLRQLLQAGATFALAKAQSNSTGHFDVPLPDPLKEASAQLTIDLKPGPNANTQTADIEAAVPHHRDSQQLLLTLQSGAWQITEANLHSAAE
jgi:hypothetical protein